MQQVKTKRKSNIKSGLKKGLKRAGSFGSLLTLLNSTSSAKASVLKQECSDTMNIQLMNEDSHTDMGCSKTLSTGDNDEWSFGQASVDDDASVLSFLETDSKTTGSTTPNQPEPGAPLHMVVVSDTNQDVEIPTDATPIDSEQAILLETSDVQLTVSKQNSKKKLTRKSSKKNLNQDSANNETSEKSSKKHLTKKKKKKDLNRKSKHSKGGKSSGDETNSFSSLDISQHSDAACKKKLKHRSSKKDLLSSSNLDISQHSAPATKKKSKRRSSRKDLLTSSMHSKISTSKRNLSSQNAEWDPSKVVPKDSDGCNNSLFGNLLSISTGVENLTSDDTGQTDSTDQQSGLNRILDSTLSGGNGVLQPLIPALIHEIKRLGDLVESMECEKQMQELERERLELRSLEEARKRTELESRLQDMQRQAQAVDSVYFQRKTSLELENSALRDRIRTLEEHGTLQSPTDAIQQIHRLKETNQKLEANLEGQKLLIEMLMDKVQFDHGKLTEKSEMRRRPSLGRLLDYDSTSPPTLTSSEVVSTSKMKRRPSLSSFLSSDQTSATENSSGFQSCVNSVGGSFTEGFRHSFRRAHSSGNLFA